MLAGPACDDAAAGALRGGGAPLDPEGGAPPPRTSALAPDAFSAQSPSFALPSKIVGRPRRRQVREPAFDKTPSGSIPRGQRLPPSPGPLLRAGSPPCLPVNGASFVVSATLVPDAGGLHRQRIADVRRGREPRLRLDRERDDLDCGWTVAPIYGSCSSPPCDSVGRNLQRCRPSIGCDENLCASG